MPDHGQTPASPHEPEVDVEFEQDQYLSDESYDPDDQPFLPEDTDDDLARRTKTRRIAFFILLGLAAVGLVVIGWFLWLSHSGKNVSLTTPARIGTLTRDDSADATSSAEYLQDALSAQINVDKAVGAVYTDGSGKNVLIFGGSTLLWNPGSDLKTAFGLISDSQGSVTGLHDVDAGKLGGTMQCGTTKSDNGTLTVCGWADHGSVVVAMFPNRTENEAAPLLRELREAMEHHG